MFQRALTPTLLEASRTFYAVALTGPKQSGKTTLLQYLFPEYTYVNLEELDTLERIKNDPRGFFQNTQQKWIIDEAQEYPELFSYLLGFIDNNKIFGQFILSGSQNFTLSEKISESLAGRIAILELPPLTYAELNSAQDLSNTTIWDIIYQGTYPGPYHTQAKTNLWYTNYLKTYLQHEVQNFIKVKDLSKFHLFLKLCASQHGKRINFLEMGAACGVSHTTIPAWLTVLEKSYIIFKLQPYYYKIGNARLIKTPKLYFYDPGLVCHLLGIESAEHAQLHASRGALFEGYVVSEIVKQHLSQGKTPNIYFWKNNHGFEVDLLIETPHGINAVEIKSSAIFNKEVTYQLHCWKKLTHTKLNNTYSIVYAGKETFNIQDQTILAYTDLAELIA